MDPELILSPMVQYGFLGFSGVLLIIIVWLISNLLKLLKDSNDVISSHNNLIALLNSSISEMTDSNRVLHNKILSRPCIHTKED